MSDTRPVVLVTGAGRRVGRAIALHLAENGYDVALHFNRSADGAVETARECAARGARAERFQADLSDAAAPDALVDRVVADAGRLDALVNSAGVMIAAPIDALTPSQWDRTFAVNVRAPFLLSRAFARVARDGGAIVNLGDHLAAESWAQLVHHGVSKAAVIALTKQLAVQLAPTVRVNVVTPGAVLAPEHWPESSQKKFADETPLRRLGTPEDVAQAVLYLLRAPYVTGHELVVDGGRHLR